ncbi:MAG: cytochrome c biogenesis protein CcsA [Sulfurimonas sp.]
MKQIIGFLGSMKLMAVLMLFFAYAIGYATFIENDFGTMTAKAEIYNTRWFELLLAVLSINLLINIFRFKMISLKKAPILIFHVSFLIIAIGAAITRFVGYEGTMRIREGATANTMISADTYFVLEASVKDDTAKYEKSLYLSKKSKNTIESSLEVGGKKVNVSLAKYIPDAIEVLVEGDSGGEEVLDMLVVDNGEARPIHLKKGEYFENGEMSIDFGSGKMFLTPTVKLYEKDGKIYASHDEPIFHMQMKTQEQGTYEPSEATPIEEKQLHALNGNNFVLKKYFKHAKKDIISDPNASPMEPQMDALVFSIDVDGKKESLTINGRAGKLARSSDVEVDGVRVSLAYGAKLLELPFSLKLNKFELDRYPGSMSPASYASEVELIDNEQNLHMPYRIYMNNVLEHRGYRFFQSSYDMDEKGTVLSVNNDPGTWWAYTGYILLGIGMFWSLFSRGNRFDKLSKIAREAASKKDALAVLFLALFISFSPNLQADIKPYDKNSADLFGQIVIQDSAGRMKPIDTLNREIIAKVSKSDNLKIGEFKLDPNQAILGMMSSPDAFRDVKLIRTKNDEINSLIGLDKSTSHASFAQFFTNIETLEGYKLAQAVDHAMRKEPKSRDKFDNAVLEVDERVNITYAVFAGTLFKIWPKANHEDNKWFATVEALQSFPEQEALAIRDIAFGFFSSIEDASHSGKWDGVDNSIKNIITYQRELGSDVAPTQKRVEMEILYNKFNIFEQSYPYYLLIGFILLIASFTKILKPSLNINILSKISLALLGFLFVAHTFGLGLRWYVAGHAPWSDGYESMIYISWATILSGFVFARRSVITLAATAVLTGLILFVAHLNWMNPQVTNLVPVLNSYWLSLHVAIITASYGFLGLGSLLGFIVLLLYAVASKQNEKHIGLAIKELNAINEMGLMIGLAFLTLGNFIGGVWANESWGRYWGWDPKETWAMVTILLYAVIVHLRFVKQIYSEFNFAVIALLAYTSVIMTYFGVNYYLAGMHSYAKGDPVPIPDFVPITYGVLFLLIAVAYRNKRIA